MQKILLALFAASLLISGCNGINPISNALFETPPYKKYIRSLEQANLDKTVMARSWIRAGEKALHDSVIVTLPFSEAGYFVASEPGARSYRFDAYEGQVLTITGTVTARENARVFLDLFTWKDNEWVSVAHGDTTLSLTYEFNENFQPCLVRIQPELLVTAYYTVSLSMTPVLINPVKGASNKSIGSFYGDPRDGGKRRHEGVDIFAKKGTPVIAPTDGYISRVGTSKLGGKVVWMQDQKRGHSYYFAHLDSQLVTAGKRVKQGEVIGTVGNTGNARYTPSHLHFGIYQRHSKDPINYIRTLQAIGEVSPWDTTMLQPDFKVMPKSLSLHAGPGEKHRQKSLLKKDTYVKVIGQSADWYRVKLPNEVQGFLPKKKITPIHKGKRERLKQGAILLTDIDAEAVPIAQIAPSTHVEVLALFDNFLYVRTSEGKFGWVMI
jgi:peptidoglycan LD-endopeptidase LytH